ncbi:PqqD family protein [bacterium]|nr:PqqD family protein [bacterium]
MSQNRLPRLAAGINRKSLGAEIVIRKGNGPALVLSVVETQVLDFCDARKDRSKLVAQLGAEVVEATLAKFAQNGFLAPANMPEQSDAIFTEVDQEIIILRPLTGQASRLDGTAAQVYKLCTPGTTVNAAIDSLSQSLKVDQEVAEELLWVSLEKLAKDGHLKNSETLPKGTSRRDFLAKFATAATLFPVVASALAPQPVHAASGDRCYNQGGNGDASCALGGLTGAVRTNSCRGCGSNNNPCPPNTFCMMALIKGGAGDCTTDTLVGQINCLLDNGADRQQGCAAARGAVAVGQIYQCCRCPDPDPTGDP